MKNHIIVFLLLFVGIIFTSFVSDAAEKKETTKGSVDSKLTLGQYMKQNNKQNEIALNNYITGIANGFFVASKYLELKESKPFICLKPADKNFNTKDSKKLLDVTILMRPEVAAKSANLPIENTILSLFLDLFPCN